MTLRVTLEIVPFGNEDEKRVIEIVNISNLGISHLGSSTYVYGVERNKYKTKEYDALVNHEREDGALFLTAQALFDLAQEVTP